MSSDKPKSLGLHNAMSDSILPSFSYPKLVSSLFCHLEALMRIPAPLVLQVESDGELFILKLGVF